MNLSTITGLISDAKNSLYTNTCFNDERRQVFKNSNIMLTDSLYTTVRKLYEELTDTSNCEKFYARFYTEVVANADVHFPGLGKPNCTLLATSLADKVLSFYKKPAESVLDAPKAITQDEKGALQYLAGYVVRKFLKKAKNENFQSMENQTIISLLSNSITEDCSNQELINMQNRGGLKAVIGEWIDIFTKVEIKFRIETNVTHMRKIDINQMTIELIQDPDLISCYNSVLSRFGIDENGSEVCMNLVENMIKLYCRVRAFSLSKDVTTKYKAASKKKKTKGGLRKNIKKFCESI